MIDIIIPAYNAHETIFQTIYSIAYQNISDLINVYIVNDSSSENYSNVVSFFSNFISIKELTLKKNSGPGVARQFGIDNSNGKYIIFIDSDDVFSSSFSVNIMYNEIKNGEYDVVTTNFVEETDNGFILKKFNNIWLHGKIFRRKFLEDNNIHFNASRSNEDNGFNQVIYLAGAKEKYLDVKTYIWRNNRESTTRKNNHQYRFGGINGYIYNIKWALNIAIEKNYNKRLIGELAFLSIIFIYFIYLEFYEAKEINNILQESKEILEISSKFNISDEDKIELLENQYNSYFDNNTKRFLLDPIITFGEFLKLLKNL